MTDSCSTRPRASPSFRRRGSAPERARTARRYNPDADEALRRITENAREEALRDDLMPEARPRPADDEAASGSWLSAAFAAIGCTGVGCDGGDDYYGDDEPASPPPPPPPAERSL